MAVVAAATAAVRSIDFLCYLSNRLTSVDQQQSTLKYILETKQKKKSTITSIHSLFIMFLLLLLLLLLKFFVSHIFAISSKVMGQSFLYSVMCKPIPISLHLSLLFIHSFIATICMRSFIENKKI